jgi:hypothetical protein
MPPNLVPMVSTGRASAVAASDATVTAISMFGQPVRVRRSQRISTITTAATAAAEAFTVPIAPPNAANFGMIAPGSFPSSVRPSNSLIWLAKMITAIPAVNPTVTG